MNTRSLLLGSAVVFALAGTGFAQTTNDATPTSKPVHHTIVHHYRHHVLHRSLHTASVHAPATPAEQVQTNDLNREQLYTAQYRSGPQNMQGGAAYYPQEPGQNNGLTPAHRIPNGLPFQAATPAGGRADMSTLSSAHRQ
jgi:hypothetical protein